ncbi:hypothetical protein ACG83_08740 [Frankia sp. R43]|uniref:VOC family protein n=1 Tax=Frankia sp. R43 TaxID=269536 RepID=UPI0006CA0C4B|nr:VOC family protein [Frankia sp. R43]KPM55433.1 hypothetical protein ACG83_08740 [Frankia sp. R43]
MINGAHAIIYSEDATATRAFFRDVLAMPHVDAHGGWLIFRLPPGELGVHPAATPDAASGATPNPAAGAPAQVLTARSGHTELSLTCDDIQAAVAELTAKGATFTSDVVDQGWGLAATFAVPGAGATSLYQPRLLNAHDQPG